MPTLLTDVVILLAAVPERPIELAPGVRVGAASIDANPWPSAGPDILGIDCRKKGSLLRSADGSMSCLEVEVVRVLRAAGLQAGWVQGFACGRQTWGEEIFARELPVPLAERNRRVQEARFTRPTSFSGHPDVAATDGTRVAYIECKVRDQPKPSQVDWIQTGIARKVVKPGEVLILRGVIR